MTRKVEKEVEDKIMEVEEAVKKFISNGCHIGLGGFTVQRHPMELIREIIRQRRRNLVLYGCSQGIDADILIGAGCVKRIEMAYVGDEPFVSPSPNFRRAVEERSIEWEDYSNFGATLRFVAGALGVPFMPTKSMLGSDMITKWGISSRSRKRRKDPRLAKKKLAVIDCPFTGEKVALVPACKPEVAIIHAQMCGGKGTVRILGQTFADEFIARAAEKVIVTCEEIISEEIMRVEPERNQIPFYLVDAIIQVPYGAHPTAVYKYYDYDPEHYAVYIRAAKAGQEAFEKYLEEYVYSVDGISEYLKKIGGEEKLDRLKADSILGYSTQIRRGEPFR